tara:strand:+ start:129 stop:953 length:825 start_codon:yes stop_codon:yes gene_type:complete
MDKLNAYKMDGLGNDFIIFDRRKKNISLTKNQIIKMSDRNNIGCDQVIIIDNNTNYGASLTFYNADGGEASACGNGSRCIAYLLMKEKKLKKISLKTKGGILFADIDKDLIRLNMGPPKFKWNEIPLIKEMDNKNLKIKISSLKGNIIENGFAINVGNPHIVFFINNINEYDIKKIGPKIENHEYFPQKCNVTIASIINNKHIKVKVWERGAGLTKACGTAACATLVSASMLKLTDRSADIEFNEGSLNINWDLNNNIYMKGQVSEIKKILVDV